MKIDKIIKLGDLKEVKVIHDLHVHSKFSLDSTQELKEYYEIANANQQTYFITTDHIEFMNADTMCNWTVDFNQLKKELLILHREFPNVTPLLGVEIGYHYKDMNQMLTTINSQDFDQIIMSVHDNGVIDYYFTDEVAKVGQKNFLNTYFDNIIEAITNFDEFDILGHFDYGFKTAYRFEKINISDYEEKIITIFKTIIQKKKTLEINSKVQNYLPDDHLKYCLKIYKQLGGVDISLASDSHDKNNYKCNFDKYIKIIKEAGFNKLCYFIKRQKYYFYI